MIFNLSLLSQIDTLHSLYIDRLTELFEANKEKYGVAKSNHLIIR